MKKVFLAIVLGLFLPAFSLAQDGGPQWAFIHPKDMNETLKRDIAEQFEDQAVRDAYREKIGSFAVLKDGKLEIRNGAVAVTDLPGKSVEVEFDWGHSGSFESAEKRKDPQTGEEKEVVVPWMANLDVLIGKVAIKQEWAFDPTGGPSIRLAFMPSGAIIAAVTDQLGKSVGDPKMVVGPKTAKGDLLHVKIAVRDGKVTVTAMKKGDSKSATLAIDTGLAGGQLGFRSREPAGPNVFEGDKKPYCAYIKNFRMKAL